MRSNIIWYMLQSKCDQTDYILEFNHTKLRTYLDLLGKKLAALSRYRTVHGLVRRWHATLWIVWSLPQIQKAPGNIMSHTINYSTWYKWVWPKSVLILWVFVGYKRKGISMVCDQDVIWHNAGLAPGKFESQYHKYRLQNNEHFIPASKCQWNKFYFAYSSLNLLMPFANTIVHEIKSLYYYVESDESTLYCTRRLMRCSLIRQMLCGGCWTSVYGKQGYRMTSISTQS